MYIQITTRCNMLCEHCCHSCTATGIDMPSDVYRAALDLADDRGDMVAIGGGEPTLHPKFWHYLIDAICSVPDDMPVWLATNGSITRTAIRLAKLAVRGVIECELSRDWYHDEIDERVVEAFGSRIRDVSGHEIAAGRGSNVADSPQTRCVCDDIFVAPSGDLYLCGCKTHKAGTVFAPKIPEDYCGECPNYS